MHACSMSSLPLLGRWLEEEQLIRCTSQFLSFLTSLHIDFQSGCTSLHSQQQCRRLHLPCASPPPRLPSKSTLICTNSSPANPPLFCSLLYFGFIIFGKARNILPLDLTDPPYQQGLKALWRWERAAGTREE